MTRRRGRLRRSITRALKYGSRGGAWECLGYLGAARGRESSRDLPRTWPRGGLALFADDAKARYRPAPFSHPPRLAKYPLKPLHAPSTPEPPGQTKCCVRRPRWRNCESFSVVHLPAVVDVSEQGEISGCSCTAATAGIPILGRQGVFPRTACADRVNDAPSLGEK